MQIEQRNSTIELLRIISMLLIVIYHFQAREFNLYVVGSDRVCEPDILPKVLMHSIGKLGVPIFVFISGWFGLKYRRNRFLEMIAMCAFYGLISVVGCALVYDEISIKAPFFFVNMWWFMCAYLCLYVLSPGINVLFDNYDKKYTLLATSFITYVSFGDLFVDSANIGGLFQMFSMYFMARWLKLYAIDWLNKWWMLCGLGLLLIRFGSITVGCMTGHLGLLPYMNSYVNPMTMLIAACLFIGFSKLKFSSLIINKLAASSLAVYLCSESSFGQKFFDGWFPHVNWSLLHYIIAAMAVYLCISVIDQVRKLMTDNLIIKRLK